MKTLLHVPCSNEMQSQHFLPSSQDLWSMPVHLFLLSAQIPPPSSFAESVRTGGVPGWRAVLGVSACANFSGNCLTRKKNIILIHILWRWMWVSCFFLFFVLTFFRCLSPLHLKYKNICFPGSNLKYEIACENWTCLFLTCYSAVGIWIPGHQQSSSHLLFIHYCWFSPLPLRRHTLGLGRWLSAPSVC